ncbi:recombinase family protein [Actinoplanes solisilvae]|uniref:recombinase family protein n=1 Tax=Actinoplanes solisilvae TaxID=2486853 RepID=UPI0013E38C2B
MRCAIYCRLSDDRTGEGLGIERQLADCRDLVGRRGGAVAGEYLDKSHSATSGRRRPDYERLLITVDSGTLDAIVAWSLDRLVRRTADLERLIELCDRRNVAIILVRGSDLDVSTPAGRLVARMLGAVARHEIDAKSDRQRRESRQRADRGLPREVAGPSATSARSWSMANPRPCAAPTRCCLTARRLRASRKP